MRRDTCRAAPGGASRWGLSGSWRSCWIYWFPVGPVFSSFILFKFSSIQGKYFSNNCLKFLYFKDNSKPSESVWFCSPNSNWSAMKCLLSEWVSSSWLSAHQAPRNRNRDWLLVKWALILHLNLMWTWLYILPDKTPKNEHKHLERSRKCTHADNSILGTNCFKHVSLDFALQMPLHMCCVWIWILRCRQQRTQEQAGCTSFPLPSFCRFPCLLAYCFCQWQLKDWIELCIRAISEQALREKP